MKVVIVVIIIIVVVIIVVVLVSCVVIVRTVTEAVLISELLQHSRTHLRPAPVSIVFRFMSMFPKTYWHDSLAKQLNDNINYISTYMKTTESLTDPHLSV